eukprot:gnl/MRDRNA2_/MRDRNA2_62710_c0_seq1.p1 gnl/MRDRNA2_/MRDRNA2_62710_c0~~gnl/MRDRNA2_/MRDRNA2_62710_c0_seq1.p1  ORF type:complete len:947 (+),score=163.64 gnl/MRDRNA2_/MRDRNA2_62710_c0_seq1:91-2931(+)
MAKKKDEDDADSKSKKKDKDGGRSMAMGSHTDHRSKSKEESKGKDAAKKKQGCCYRCLKIWIKFKKSMAIGATRKVILSWAFYNLLISAYILFYGIYFTSSLDIAYGKLKQLRIWIAFQIMVILASVVGVLAGLLRSPPLTRAYFFAMPLNILCSVPATWTLWRLKCRCINFGQCQALTGFAEWHGQSFVNPFPTPADMPRYADRVKLAWKPMPDNGPPGSLVDLEEMNETQELIRKEAAQGQRKRHTRNGDKWASTLQPLPFKGRASKLTVGIDDFIVKLSSNQPPSNLSVKVRNGDENCGIPEFPKMHRESPSVLSQKAATATAHDADRPKTDADPRNAYQNGIPLAHGFVSIAEGAPPKKCESKGLRIHNDAQFRRKLLACRKDASDSLDLRCPKLVDQKLEKCGADPKCGGLMFTITPALAAAPERKGWRSHGIPVPKSSPKSSNKSSGVRHSSAPPSSRQRQDAGGKSVLNKAVAWNMETCMMEYPAVHKNGDNVMNSTDDDKKWEEVVELRLFFVRDMTKSLKRGKDNTLMVTFGQRISAQEQASMTDAGWLHYMEELRDSGCFCRYDGRGCAVDWDAKDDRLRYWCKVKKRDFERCSRNELPGGVPKKIGLTKLPNDDDEGYWTQDICTYTDPDEVDPIENKVLHHDDCICMSGTGIRVEENLKSELSPKVADSVQNHHILIGHTCNKWYKSDKTRWCVVGFDTACADREELRVRGSSTLRLWKSSIPCQREELQLIVENASELCKVFRYTFYIVDTPRYIFFPMIVCWVYIWLQNRCADSNASSPIFVNPVTALFGGLPSTASRNLSQEEEDKLLEEAWDRQYDDSSDSYDSEYDSEEEFSSDVSSDPQMSKSKGKARPKAKPKAASDSDSDSWDDDDPAEKEKAKKKASPKKPRRDDSDGWSTDDDGRGHKKKEKKKDKKKPKSESPQKSGSSGGTK